MKNAKQVLPINITHLTEEYGPGYIAKDKKTGKVVAHARRVDILMEKIKKEKRNEIVISWIPKHGARYLFNAPQIYQI